MVPCTPSLKLDLDMTPAETLQSVLQNIAIGGSSEVQIEIQQQAMEKGLELNLPLDLFTPPAFDRGISRPSVRREEQPRTPANEIKPGRLSDELGYMVDLMLHKWSDCKFLELTRHNAESLLPSILQGRAEELKQRNFSMTLARLNSISDSVESLPSELAQGSEAELKLDVSVSLSEQNFEAHHYDLVLVQECSDEENLSLMKCCRELLKS